MFDFGEMLRLYSLLVLVLGKFENNVAFLFVKCLTTDNKGMKYSAESLKHSCGWNAHN